MSDHIRHENTHPWKDDNGIIFPFIRHDDDYFYKVIRYEEEIVTTNLIPKSRIIECDCYNRKSMVLISEKI